jgi:hypothetical protein
MTAEAGLSNSRVLNKLAYAIATQATDIGIPAGDDRYPVYDTSGALVGYTQASAALAIAPVSLTATTVLTAAAHANRPLLMGASGAALTFTLPAATGSGNKYTFLVSVVNTSNYLIKASAGTMLFKGMIVAQSATDSATDAARTWVAGATDDTITLNGTTTGGKDIGNWIEFTDCSATMWGVRGFTTASGTEATPFSDTVA